MRGDHHSLGGTDVEQFEGFEVDLGVWLGFVGGCVSRNIYMGEPGKSNLGQTEKLGGEERMERELGGLDDVELEAGRSVREHDSLVVQTWEGMY